ncbi:uncharacterized protein LODBEIA_P39870 [Lodderomyces beijingensis]|uniref:Anaphase-promoting complex subunit 5 n=1 Tax=Lodderomyces beijingensis TaxID=1775926 RepID=A0ABP0ZNM8_9ASCO
MSNGFNSSFNFYLFEDISPLDITILIAIGLHSSYKTREDLSPRDLLQICRLVEHKLEPEEIPKYNDLGTFLTIFDSRFAHILQAESWRIQDVEDLNSLIRHRRESLSDSSNAVVRDAVGVNWKIGAKSVFGTFVMRVCAQYELLEFDGCAQLYQSFVGFRESTSTKFVNTRTHYRHHEEQEEEEQGQDEVNDDDEDDDVVGERLYNALEHQLSKIGAKRSRNKKSAAVTISRSKLDMEKLVDRQIAVLESHGTPTPGYLREILNMMTNVGTGSGGHEPNFHAVPSCYYLNYLEHLACSDYNSAVDSLHQYFDYMVSNNSKYFYHFALVSKASLHSFFGEDKQAIDAIVEAISVARENKDNATLTYILSWFYNFMQNKPWLWQSQDLFSKESQEHLLDFLIKKSSSVNSSLLAINLGFETMRLVRNGSCGVDEYMGNLAKTMFIAVNDDIGATTFVRCAELASCVWQMVGVTPLAQAYGDLALRYSLKSSDNVSILSRRLYREFSQGRDRDKCVSEMADLKSSYFLHNDDDSLYNSIQIRYLMMQAKISLIQGRARMARELISVLLDSDCKDLELKTELLMLEIEVCKAFGNYSDALDKLAAIPVSDGYLMLRLNILKCEIFHLSGNPYRVLSTVVQSIESCRRFGFVALLIQAQTCLISMLSSLGYEKDAARLRDEIMPTVESYGNEDFRKMAIKQT